MGALAALALLVALERRARDCRRSAAALAALLLAPAVWAFDTLGYATSGTFPAGGPESVSAGGGFGGPGGGFGGPGAGVGAGAGRGGPPAGLSRTEAREGALPGGAGTAGGPAGLFSGGGAGPGAQAGAPPSAGGSAGAGPGGVARFGGGASRGGAAGGGSPFGDGSSLNSVSAYVRAHGGGTIAVSSQSSAASAIISSDASVAGIGGFSGRESSVSIAWLAQEVRSGKIRWVLAEGQGSFGGGGLPGDTRTGSQRAIAAAEAVCTRVTISGSRAASGSAGASGTGSDTSSVALYDCQGRGWALAARAA